MADRGTVVWAPNPFKNIVGQQGPVTDEFTEQVTTATISYRNSSKAADPA